MRKEQVQMDLSLRHTQFEKPSSRPKDFKMQLKDQEPAASAPFITYLPCKFSDPTPDLGNQKLKMGDLRPLR